ncbi:hypothetical protein Rsub_13008 [Raphidocelis subcapitata]|uniref:VOC domain-containing protein n=1 Tax=Raphidocelis subcapitata TaxID=307507 RepID=A0A2V0PQ53_9CHLO|nr:hypothetical protein Rsub_13008 [Raphidocelis subcapitata]|eukprot:GBG00191.1 hypothetical protein Rsub_13008 [Raphidocelis subcapitata]
MQTAKCLRVAGPDHIVVRSPDPAASTAWWSRMFGLEPLRLAEYQAGAAPFPSVRVTPSFIIDFAGREMAALAAPKAAAAAAAAAPPEPPRLEPASGQLDHLCLSLDDGADMAAVAAALSEAGAPPLQQFDGTVVRRFGARGGALSVYVRTPEGVTLELRSYPADGAPPA